MFRMRKTPKGEVNVNVEAGVVYLRGELGSQDEIDELVAAAADVDGVREVRSLLHLPGEPVPDKEWAPATAPR
jgi:osmotically-inducible protein OsmY